MENYIGYFITSGVGVLSILLMIILTPIFIILYGNLIGFIVGTGRLGLYLINKKLGEKYAWLSFIPLINIYSHVKASGKSLWWILWLILGYIFFIIPGLILNFFILYSIAKRCERNTGTAIGLFCIPSVMFLSVGIELNKIKQVKNTSNLDSLKKTTPKVEL